MATRAKREPAAEAEPDEHLDENVEADTLSGAIPEGERALARSLAKRMGWAPKESWTRDPAKWEDEIAFLEKTTTAVEDLQARNKALQERSERVNQAAAQAIEDERRRVRDEATKVIREADDPDVRAKAAERLAQNAGPPPQTVAWIAKNPWFDTDPDAQALAIAAIQRAEKEGANIPDALAKGEDTVRKRFPEYFANGGEQRLSDVRRAAPIAPQVQNGTRAPSAAGPKEKGWAEIPRADRDAFDRHMLKAYHGKGLSDDKAHAEYAAGYWQAGTLPPDEREEDPWVREKRTNPWGRR